MLKTRLSVGPYLLAWLLLSGLQLWCASQAIAQPQLDLVAYDVTQTPALNPYWIAVLVVQLLKLPITLWRLNDTGRAPDEVLYALIPIGNVVLWSFCLERTPKKRRDKRVRGRRGQIGPFAALAAGVGLAGKTALPTLPFLLGYAVISGSGAYWAVRQLDAVTSPESLAALTQGLFILSGFLGLYTLLQALRRSKVTRASWFPALFFVPTLLLAGAFKLHLSGAAQGVGAVLLIFLLSAWNLLWMSIAGAGLAIAWLLAAQRVQQGKPIAFGELIGEVMSRLVSVSAPHGARVHAVTIGMQVLVPGVFWALQYAFVDMIAVLDPERPALKESANLTYGIRARLFKMFAIWLLVSMVGANAIIAGLDGTNAAYTGFFDPRAYSLASVVATEVFWGLTLWVLQLGLLVIYQERLARRARREAKKAEKAAALAASAADQGAENSSP